MRSQCTYLMSLLTTLMTLSMLSSIAKAEPGYVDYSNADSSSVYPVYPDWRIRGSIGLASSNIDNVENSLALDGGIVKMIDDSVGVEVGASLYPAFDAEVGDSELQVYSFKMGITGYGKQYDNLQYFLRIGIHFSTAETTSGSTTTDSLDEGMYAGFGANYKLEGDLSVVAEYQRLMNVEDADFNTFLIGLEYPFY